jgi:hypothetical protein
MTTTPLFDIRWHEFGKLVITFGIGMTASRNGIVEFFLDLE